MPIQITLRNNILLILTLIILLLPAMHPFLLGEMPRTDDGLLHLYRSISLEHSIRVDGAIWPRYSSGLVFGYGAPLFNYFPPTSYYPMVVLQTLGIHPINAWLWTMVFYTFMAGMGSYLLGSALFDVRGGLITAAAYVYAPYFLFDTVTRGTSSEVAALAILPWVLWTFQRLAHRGQRSDFLAATLCLTIFVPIHNIVTLHSAVLIAVFCLYLWLSAESKRRVFLQMLTAGLLAFVMTSFFWLPALGETNAVKINQIAENLPSVDVTRYLRPLEEVFAWPIQADPTQLQPPTPIALGWPALIAACAAILLSFRQSRSLRALTLALAAVTILFIFMNTPPSAELWRNLPLLNYSQFAWRTLGIPSLTLALLTGLSAHWILKKTASKTTQTVLFCVFMIILVSYAMPWLYTPYIDVSANSIQDAQNYERQTGELTLSSYSEYLPISNEVTPDPEAIRSRFAQSDIIPRLQSNDEVNLIESTWRGTSAIIRIETDNPTELIFDWLYSPGWVAEILEQEFTSLPLTVKASGAEGFVSVEVPAGVYTLSIQLQDTALQRTANISSIIAAVVLVAVVLISPIRFWNHRPSEDRISIGSLNKWLIATSLVGFGMFSIKALLIDQTQNPIRNERFANGISAGVDQPIEADFSGEITLLGVSIPKSSKSGDLSPFSLFWSLSGDQTETDYSSLIEMRDLNGLVLASSGSFQPGELATSNWLPGYYLHEQIQFRVPDHIPPGIYTFTVSLYEPQSLRSLNWLNESGNPIDVKVPIGNMEILRNDRPRPIDQLPVGQADVLALYDLKGLPEIAQAGDAFTLQWLWGSDNETNSNLKARLVWAQDDTAIEGPYQDLVAGYPTSNWQEGDLWQGTHLAYIPGSLKEGRHSIAIEIQDEFEGIVTRIETDQEVMVSIPERNYQMPDLGEMESIAWDNGIRLIGYEANSSINSTVSGLTLTLYWQTTEEISESLNLFVHALDGEQIVAQTDGVPVDWTRPTTSWVTDEIIITQHRFTLDDGNYKLRIGWYNPLNNTRIELANGQNDAVDLPLLISIDEQ